MNAATPSAPPAWRLPRNFHHLLLAIGSILVLLLLGSSAWQATASLKALNYLRQQSERVEHLDSLLVQMVDAENAVRGYLLSGNRNHLGPYESTSLTAHQTLAAIRRDLDPGPDNDAAVADLSALVAAKLHSLDQAVDRGIAGPDAGTAGKANTDRIRERIQGLEARLAAEGKESFLRSTEHVERTRWVVGTLAAAALILTAILYVALEKQFQLRGQIASMLESENQRLDALVQERTAELSDLASYLTNAREAEKARLARELHDELGALLTAAKMESDWVAHKLNGAARDTCGERLVRLEELLDRGIALKRRIIDGLRPPFLEELGLVATLRALGEEFGRDGEETLNLDLPAEDLDLAPAPALALYRIAQEALTNVRKHAHARQVTLVLRRSDGRLELEIADDGVGFRSGLARARHHGLGGMKHRVQMCAGDFRLTSQPGVGTRIRVEVPVETTTVADQEASA
jgi:signal transduction histidine kinase